MEEENKYLLPDKVYDVLKWVGLVVCPALATLTLTVGNTVGWADTAQPQRPSSRALGPSSAHASASAR